MTKSRSAPSTRARKAVKGVAPLASPEAGCTRRASPSGVARRPAMASEAKRSSSSSVGLPRDGLEREPELRAELTSRTQRPPVAARLAGEQEASGERPARKPQRPVLRQARVRSVSFDPQHQAPCITFEVPHLRRGEQFCRVRTQPATDVRRTRFGLRQVELVIYGPLFWRVGDTTTLELEPYGPAALTLQKALSCILPPPSG